MNRIDGFVVSEAKIDNEEVIGIASLEGVEGLKKRYVNNKEESRDLRNT